MICSAVNLLRFMSVSFTGEQTNLKVRTFQGSRSVRMVPDRNAPGAHQIELVGDLAGILGLAAPDMSKPPRLARAGGDFTSETMVAGAGFEPAAFRL
ncbi:hypothetical protein GCM10010991_34780 [Gemmobacter aquaticus]|uniref:Uncharacterized protein n=1 Tax=Gemmobacter aquaticus TaxID=490185 RepID=A0A917YMU6_9RHOB|nr:hypothetical protein GCM10010991_34780 [Gemmobacter aquaticus]